MSMTGKVLFSIYYFQLFSGKVDFVTKNFMSQQSFQAGFYAVINLTLSANTSRLWATSGLDRFCASMLSATSGVTPINVRLIAMSIELSALCIASLVSVRVVRFPRSSTDAMFRS